MTGSRLRQTSMRHDAPRVGPRMALWIALGVSALAACGTAEEAVDYGNPSAELERSREGLRMRVEGPGSGSILREGEADLRVAIADDLGDAPRFAVLREGQVLVDETVPGAEGTVRVRIPLAHGSNAFRLRVSSADGRRVLDQNWIVRFQGDGPGLQVRGWRRFDPTTGTCGEAILRPLTGAQAICVVGRVSGGTSPVARVEARIGTDAVSASPTEAGTFELPVQLRPDRRNRIDLRVVDGRGRTLDSLTELVHDGTPPEIVLSSPGDNPVQTLDERWVIEGSASDPSGVAQVCFDVRDTPRACLATRDAFRWPVGLVPGANEGAVIARDVLGNESRVPFVIERVPAIRLRPPSSTPARAVLGLDRAGLDALFGEADQRAIVIAEVELRAPLTVALERLADPAGSGLDTSAWGAPEWNLYRLLSVTPDTADLRDTVFDELVGVAAAIGLPAPRVLARMLGIGVEAPVLPIATLVDVLLDQLVATHPAVERNAAGEPVFRVTLFDALRELTPLFERFGPVGDHPGVLAAPPRGVVLENGFLFRVDATSRLRAYECVDTSRRGKDHLFLPPASGPSIAFDFDDPERFAVAGLVDEPEVSFTFAVEESPVFHEAGRDRSAGSLDRDGDFARGDGSAWDAPDWVLERVIVEAARRTFMQRFAAEGWQGREVWSAGSIAEAAVMTWDRGWIEIRTAGDLGNPPRPSFVWDALLEIAQVRLHDGGIPEGEANVRFEIPDVPVGVDAETLIERMRPLLRSQEAQLSRAILGDGGGLVPSRCDVALLDEGAALAIVHDGDLPGFFEDEALTRRVSLTALEGVSDAAWEKVRPRDGATWFFPDREGRAWQLDVLQASADEVRVRVRPVEAR